MITASEARSISEDDNLRYKSLLEKLSLAIYSEARKGNTFFWVEDDYDPAIHYSEIKPFKDRLKFYLETHGYSVEYHEDEMTINW